MHIYKYVLMYLVTKSLNAVGLGALNIQNTQTFHLIDKNRPNVHKSSFKYTHIVRLYCTVLSFVSLCVCVHTHFLWQQINVLFVPAGGGVVELDESEGLGGGSDRHDEGGNAGAAEIDKAALGNEDDPLAVRPDHMVHL